MGYPINPPPHTIIERDPTFTQILRGLRRRDWGIVAFSACASAPFGYMVGRPVVPVPSMWVAVGIGALGGMFIGLESSFSRLTGYAENTEEVAALQRGIGTATHASNRADTASQASTS